LVEDCPWNLAEYSEDLSNGVWSTTLATITANATTAPNGTLTADKLVEDTSNNIHRVGQGSISVESGQIYTFSFYAKAGERNELELQRINTSGTVFNSISTTTANLTLGTLTVGSNVTASSIESVGNGWYRISVSLTAIATGSGGVNIGLMKNGNVSYLGDGTSGAFIWGAQLNIGATAKPYFPTTDRLNVPRLTYQNGGGGCPSLLLEKQSTNLLTWSEDFTQTDWGASNLTITANDAISPDGTQNAEKFTTTSTSAENQVRQSTFSILGNVGSSYTTSVYAKKGTANYLRIRNLFVQNGDTFGNAWFNLNTGAVGTVQSSQTASIQNMGNGWYRCILTGVVGSSNNYNFVDIGFSDGETNIPTTSVNGYVWGAQLEASSYGTSYINTTSASATRVADACFKTGISSLIGQSQGTIFIDAIMKPTAGSYDCIMSVNDGAFANSVNVFTNTAGDYYYEIYSGGAVQATQAFSTLPVTRMKIAVAWNSTNSVVYANGSLLYTSSAITTPSGMGSFNFSGPNNSYTMGKKEVNEFLSFTTKLTASELIALTTI
jgi:hypothetical protein